ncbi:replication protein P [Zooshikella ganghwensis]|uniref:replication protein P n=1 Tax=Zooshikella ganghwensis TaxID=202772 RepID=UPI000409B36F|nr:replication protein P [Zooshikella ganghwensis]
MKTPKDLLAGVPLAGTSTAGIDQPHVDSISKHAAELVNVIFRELQGIFPAWKQAFSDMETLSSAKRNWTKGFIDNGIVNVAQVRTGLSKARQIARDFVPSVGTFIAWCNLSPDDAGLPQALEAYHEACEKAHAPSPQSVYWSHPVVYQAAKSTGFFELKSRREQDIFPLFKRNYTLACQQVLAGESLTDLPKALTDQSPKTLAEKNKDFHDRVQEKYLQECGFNQLDNPQAALNCIYELLGRKLN